MSNPRYHYKIIEVTEEVWQDTELNTYMEGGTIIDGVSDNAVDEDGNEFYVPLLIIRVDGAVH